VNEPRCALGEGLYIDDNGGLWWLDILNCLLLHSSGGVVFTFEVPEIASKVLGVKNGLVILASESGITELDTRNSRWLVKRRAPALSWPGRGRTNDACWLNDNTMLVGRMDFNPTPGSGDVVRFFENNASIILENIAIPNTFIILHSENAVLISDSFTKKTYWCKLPLHNEERLSPKLWHDFSAFPGTPDGGLLASDGNVYIAMWGMSAIAKLNSGGELLGLLNLEVLQPTSIVEDPSGNFVITSATEGMSNEDLKICPLAGYVTYFPWDKRP
jgi:sugar lactone lactonase YvrE